MYLCTCMYIYTHCVHCNTCICALMCVNPVSPCSVRCCDNNINFHCHFPTFSLPPVWDHSQEVHPPSWQRLQNWGELISFVYCSRNRQCCDLWSLLVHVHTYFCTLMHAPIKVMLQSSPLRPHSGMLEWGVTVMPLPEGSTFWVKCQVHVCMYINFVCQT